MPRQPEVIPSNWGEVSSRLVVGSDAFRGEAKMSPKSGHRTSALSSYLRPSAQPTASFEKNWDLRSIPQLCVRGRGEGGGEGGGGLGSRKGAGGGALISSPPENVGVFDDPLLS